MATAGSVKNAVCSRSDDWEITERDIISPFVGRPVLGQTSSFGSPNLVKLFAESLFALLRLTDADEPYEPLARGIYHAGAYHHADHMQLFFNWFPVGTNV